MMIDDKIKENQILNLHRGNQKVGVFDFKSLFMRKLASQITGWDVKFVIYLVHRLVYSLVRLIIGTKRLIKEDEDDKFSLQTSLNKGFFLFLGI